MSDLDNVDVNILYSTTKIHLFKDFLSPGLTILGIIRILRADPPKNILIGGSRVRIVDP